MGNAVLKGKSTKALPVPLALIELKSSLKLLGVTFQSDPCNWDLHLDNILSKASSRLHILRVCKFYGLPLDHLHILFTSLILPILTYAVEEWGCAYYHKYLNSIDRLFKRAFKLGYCKERFFIENIIALKDEKLLYSWRFSRYSAPIYWLVHCHMTSNNETAGNIAKTMTSTVHCYPRNVDRCCTSFVNYVINCFPPV